MKKGKKYYRQLAMSGIGNYQITVTTSSGELTKLVLHDVLYVPESSNRLSAYGVEICFPPPASKTFYSIYRQPLLKSTEHGFNSSKYF